MIQDIQQIQKLFQNNMIDIRNKRLAKTMLDYSFLFVSNDLNFEDNQEIYKNIKESPIIIFNHIHNKELFFIGFEKTVIIINQNSLSFLEQLFKYNSDLSFCFLPNKQENFGHSFNIQFNEIQSDNIFLEEIDSLNQQLNIKNRKEITSPIRAIWKQIKVCISGYLIKKSYSKINQKRLKKFYSRLGKKDTKINYDEDEFIILRKIGLGTFFITELVYNIEKEELFIIKKPLKLDPEIDKLMKRELNNYSIINHMFLPKFYGTINKKNYLVIEFINGQSLLQIKEMKLNIQNKLAIIMEIMLAVKYIHDNQYILRDLKPGNIIIDKNKTAVVIDFDRMIPFDSTDLTNDFGSIYAAPENNNNGHVSFKSDIYSIGKIIYFIMNEKPLLNYKYNEIKFFDDYNEIKLLYQRCISINSDNRPSISELITAFNNSFHLQIKSKSLIDDLEGKELKMQNENFLFSEEQNIPFTLFMLGAIYHEGQYVNFDINKAIYYYSLAATQNDPDAQYNLGVLYQKGQYVKFDIKKAIFYYSQAANQNHLQALINLGNIYYENKYIPRDINKVIHYFSLASDSKSSYAQYILGVIYFEGNFVEQDIDKTIHYYSLAADQNHSKAQFNLGNIYFEGKYVIKDINKAIHYYTLAASQNLSQAQFTLGFTYYEGKYVERDINKTLHYYTLAANQNHPYAQFSLGNIYFEGKHVTKDIQKAIYYYSLASLQSIADAQLILGYIYSNDDIVKHDINKAIHYYSLAANQNNSLAQFNLGKIFYEGKYIARDINQAIYLFSQAANQNHLESQILLGTLYYEGRYIERNINKAIHYYSLAANQNNPNAQFILGDIYDRGQSIDCDMVKAIYYYSLAAKQDYPYAQFNLGCLYYEGRYIERDINKAIQYFSLAADHNLPQAQFNLGIIYYECQYISPDINKAIHYYSLAANQNFPQAQINLGSIYYDGKYIPRDINKAIHYYSLAVDQNHPQAQFILAAIYYEGKYVQYDVNKAIHYFSLAANQNHAYAQFMLGVIYYEGKRIKHDIKKAIHYFTLAANQNDSHAQFNLGLIYIVGKDVTKDVNKAFHYLTLAANKNIAQAQFILGIYYYEGKYVTQNIKKGIYLLSLSSKNGYKHAYFVLGYLNHEGRNIKQDIEQAIRLYKEATSFNDQYAKNNLAIIYKNGYEKIQCNTSSAIEYLIEAIHQKNDFLAKYNLANILMYDEGQNKNLDKSLELLISSSYHFIHSKILICLLLVKIYGFNLEIIKKVIKQKTDELNELSMQICQIAIDLQIYNKSSFEKLYELYRDKYFLYNSILKPISVSDFRKQSTYQKSHENNLLHEISSEFYEGFGSDLL